MPWLQKNIVKLQPLPNMSQEEIEAQLHEHIGSGEDLRKFVQDVDSGKIIHFSWDCDIPFEEFRKRVLEGYYDEK
ncbi:MAG: hypothetical protein K2K44_04130 [Oscillospiraceae bacterium]|nr:hypothetical protein [Oscillospiraceae bacterium]